MRCYAPQNQTWYPFRKAQGTHLKATNTVSAFCACTPNTLSKNSEATVVSDSKISILEDALYRKHSHSEFVILEGVCESTHAKYAILAKMYNVAVIPSPSGPAILRVRTGFLTSLRT